MTLAGRERRIRCIAAAAPGGIDARDRASTSIVARAQAWLAEAEARYRAAQSFKASARRGTVARKYCYPRSVGSAALSQPLIPADITRTLR